MEPLLPPSAAQENNKLQSQDELQDAEPPAVILQLIISKLSTMDQNSAGLVSRHFRANVLTQARSEQNALVTNLIQSITKNLNAQKYPAEIAALSQLVRACPVFTSLSLLSIKDNLLTVRRDVVNQLKNLNDSELLILKEAVKQQPLPLHFHSLFDIVAIYRQLERHDVSYETRCRLAKELITAGDLEKAIEILIAKPATDKDERRQRAEVCNHVVEEFGKAGKFHKARSFFAAVLDASLVPDQMKSLARKLAESGHFDEALKAAESDRASIVMIIEQLAKAKQFDKALLVAKMLGNSMPSDVCYILATELAKAGDFERAIKLAKAFTDNNEMIYNPVRSVVKEFGRVGEVSRALELLTPIQDDYRRNMYVREMVQAMADAGKFEEALVANMHISGEHSGYFRPTSLAYIGRSCLQVGKFELAIDIACIIEDPTYKSQLLLEIGRKQVEMGQITQAIETIKLAQDPVVESEFLLEVVSHIKKQGDYLHARSVAKSIPDLEIRRKILATLPEGE